LSASPQNIARGAECTVEPLIALVGEPLALIGAPLALVGEPLALVGDVLSLISQLLALIGDTVSLFRLLSSLVELPPQLLTSGSLRHCSSRLSGDICHLWAGNTIVERRPVR
jgi:hypothetical protein